MGAKVIKDQPSQLQIHHQVTPQPLEDHNIRDHSSEGSKMILGKKRKTPTKDMSSPNQSRFINNSYLVKPEEDSIEENLTPRKVKKKTNIFQRAKAKQEQQIISRTSQQEVEYTVPRRVSQISKDVSPGRQTPGRQAHTPKINDKLQSQLQELVEKHQFINYWYRGPSFENRNQNLYVKNDKVIIIEEDDTSDNAADHFKEDMLSELISQHISPTQFIIGDKQKILQKMKAEEERLTKERIEEETKKLMKKSDVRMTIYPHYDNFFQKN